MDIFWTFYLNHLSPLWGYFCNRVCCIWGCGLECVWVIVYTTMGIGYRFDVIICSSGSKGGRGGHDPSGPEKISHKKDGGRIDFTFLAPTSYSAARSASILKGNNSAIHKAAGSRSASSWNYSQGSFQPPAPFSAYGSFRNCTRQNHGIPGTVRLAAL